MNTIIQDILASDRTHKEKVAMLVLKIKNNDNLLALLFELLKTGTDVEKGTCAEVMKFVSKENPGIMIPYIDVLIEYINYKAPRVKWGAPESIGNLAKQYPQKVENAIPYLLKNLDDKSTVVRWCAAFALTEITKYNLGKQEELTGTFSGLMEKEKNNGVKNLYIKALKTIDKQRK
ncbi:MAG: hypothetical protein JXB88_18785 [Spirochaetales bacterium]|nr:hypothetical protein [Spirochaetales bacterium]